MTLDPSVQAAINGQLATAITIVGGVFITVIAVLGAWGLAQFRKKLGISETDHAAYVFENAISNGLQVGAQKVAQRMVTGERVTNKVQSVIGAAHEYAAPKVADVLPKLGISPGTLLERIAGRADPAKIETQITAALNLQSRAGQLPGQLDRPKP